MLYSQPVPVFCALHSVTFTFITLIEWALLQKVSEKFVTVYKCLCHCLCFFFQFQASPSHLSSFIFVPFRYHPSFHRQGGFSLLQGCNDTPVHHDIFCHDTNIVYQTSYQDIYDTFTYASTNMGQDCLQLVFTLLLFSPYARRLSEQTDEKNPC